MTTGSGVRIQAAKYSDAYLQRADMQRGYTRDLARTARGGANRA